MPTGNGRRRKKAQEGEAGAIQDGRLLVNVEEMLVWARLKSGDYNRNEAYAHAVVSPAVPWFVAIPVDEAEGTEAVRQAICGLQDAIHAAVKEKVSELQRQDGAELRKATAEAMSKHVSGVEVRTSVGSIEGDVHPRPSVEAAVGDPSEDEEDF